MKRILCMILILSGGANVQAQDGQDPVDKSLMMDYFQEQQYGKIISYLEETVKPRHVNGLSMLANAYYLNGEPMQAEKHYKRVLELDSNHISANQHLGAIARGQKNSAAAVPYFGRLLQLRPDNAAYYKQMANACAEVAGLQDTAFYYMKQSYRLNPRDVSVVTFLGSEYLDRKDYAKADSVLGAYYAFDSSQAIVSARLIRSAYEQKKFRDITLYGERLLSRNVVDPISFAYLAVAHYHLKQYDSCIRVHDQMMITVQAATETVKYYAALAYAEKMQYDSSNTLLTQCIDMAKSKSLDSYYTTLANNFEQMKQYKNAIAHYDTAYFLFRDPMRQYGIARIYDQYMQDPVKAKKFYQQFVKNARPEGKNETDVRNYARERLKSL